MDLSLYTAIDVMVSATVVVVVLVLVIQYFYNTSSLGTMPESWDNDHLKLNTTVTRS